jgi:nucleoside-diphosphate-sugar epimerase
MSDGVSNGTNPLADDLDHVLAHTRDLWEELRGQRLFMTGGTGFFGCWLLESFTWACDRLDLGAEAVVLTRRPEAFKQKAPHLAGHPAVRLHSGDVRNFAFPEGPFSHVIHAATESSTSLNDDDPLLMLDTIIEGTRRTLEFARQSGATKFLLTSSGAVYGRQPPDMTHVPEDNSGAPTTIDPRSAYGEGKRVAELLCAIYAQRHGLETKIARCFAFVGPYLPLDVHFAIGNFIRDVLGSGPIVVKSDGTPMRSYLYAADLAIWLLTILCQGEACRPYNVGSNDAVSINELATLVAGKGNWSPTVRVCGVRQLGQPLQRYVPSIERPARELGLSVHIGLSASILRTVRWYASQPRFCVSDPSSF